MHRYANINYCWAGLMVEELTRQGVAYFCVAPGSRSSPLAVSMARHTQAKIFVHFDERGLAFHALGYAAATGKPVVLLCTSGTAVANFLPAVVEAAKKKLPLIVITADRPPELRQTGAVQTIDQVGIFGKYVSWAVDMPCPDIQIKPAYVLTTIGQAVYHAVSRRAVVHLNCMFREPLTPVKDTTDMGVYLKGISRWLAQRSPFTRYVKSGPELNKAALESVAATLSEIKNGVIVVGKIEGDGARNAVVQLAKHLGWPIFADISSGLRLGVKDAEIIAYFDQILLKPPAIAIDGVLHVGGRMTSKRYYEFMIQQTVPQYVMVLNHGLRSDPDHQVTLRVEARVEDFCKRVKPMLPIRKSSPLLKSLIQHNARIHKAIDVFFADDTRVSEPRAARLVSTLLPKGSGLYVSNSMPIRDMDMFAHPGGNPAHVCGNRGASGIDGLIASAIGYAQGLKAPVTLMVGDLAALYDLNSLAMLKDAEYPVVIVILNNGGGGIFSFLPIAQEKDVFEKLYGTPHPFAFANAAAMFELNYAQPQSVKEFTKVYGAALKSSTSSIIEVMTGREENLKVHRALQSCL